MGRHDIGKDGAHFLSYKEEKELADAVVAKRVLIVHRRTIRFVCKFAHEITGIITIHVVALGVIHYAPHIVTIIPVA